MNFKAVNAGGPIAFEASGVLDTLSTNLGSKNAEEQVEALNTIVSLATDCDQWMEPYMVSILPSILDCLSAPKTAAAATEAGEAILKKSNSHSVRVVTSKLYESFTSMKWQTKKV